jgi:hypothetical protein
MKTFLPLNVSSVNPLIAYTEAAFDLPDEGEFAFDIHRLGAAILAIPLGMHLLAAGAAALPKVVNKAFILRTGFSQHVLADQRPLGFDRFQSSNSRAPCIRRDSAQFQHERLRL